MACALNGQAPPLVIVEKDSFLPEFLFEDLIFCDQVLDHLLLLAINPSGQTEEKYLPRPNNETHNSPMKFWTRNEHYQMSCMVCQSAEMGIC